MLTDLLAALEARLPAMRKALVSAAGAGATAAVLWLGPEWAAIIPMLITIAGVYGIGNDRDGDGEVTVREFAETVASDAIDRLVDAATDRFPLINLDRIVAETVAAHVEPAGETVAEPDPETTDLRTAA